MIRKKWMGARLMIHQYYHIVKKHRVNGAYIKSGAAIFKSFGENQTMFLFFNV